MLDCGYKSRSTVLEGLCRNIASFHAWVDGACMRLQKSHFRYPMLTLSVCQCSLFVIIDITMSHGSNDIHHCRG